MVEADRPQITIKRGPCSLHTGYIRLKTHTHNMQYLLLSHCNIGCTNAPLYYGIRTLPVLSIL